MSAPLHNDVFLRACLRQPTEYTPVWLMRQAGRYLPEYRDSRARAGSFMGLATNPGYATEVTLQPLERYPLDAAILFSDILTVPDAMGLGLSFAQGEGPKFEKVVRDEAAVNALAVPDMDKLRYVFDAVTSIRRALDGRVPLIGFSGSPWTLACYMVEGGGSDDYRQVKSLMYARPDLMHRILSINADAVAAYLNAQIDAGAQAVMIFDSWGGVLADGQFQQFSLAYSRRVLSQLKTEHEGRRVPRLLFTKGGGLWLDEIAEAGADVVGLDWTVNLGRARAVAGPRGAAGQPGSERPLRAAGRRPRAGARGAGQLRRAATGRWRLGRTCLQPRARHQPVHAAGKRRRAGRRGASPFPRAACRHDFQRCLRPSVIPKSVRVTETQHTRPSAARAFPDGRLSD